MTPRMPAQMPADIIPLPDLPSFAMRACCKCLWYSAVVDVAETELGGADADDAARVRASDCAVCTAAGG